MTASSSRVSLHTRRASRSKRAWHVLAMVAVLSLVGAACSSSDSDETTTTAAVTTTSAETTTTTAAPATTTSVAAVPGDPVPAFTLFTPAEDRSPQNFKSAPLIADAWRELGLEVDVQAVELFELFGQVFREFDFQVSLFQWTPRVDRLDPFAYLSFAAPGSVFDGSGWESSEFAELFAQQSSQFDPNTRRETIFRLQEILTEELPMTVTFYADDVLAFNQNTIDGVVAMPGEGLYNEWTPLRAQSVKDTNVLTIGDAGEPESINPYNASSATAWAFLRLYYDKLVRLSPTIEPVLWGAEAINWLDDTTLEVVVRDGMTFHDGEPVTADDVAFSYQTLIDNEVAYFEAFVAPLESVAATDSSTVVFEFSEPFSPFVNVTMSQVPILPKHLWEGIANPVELDPADVPTVGSGPFVFDRFDRGEFMRLTSNADHFDPPLVDAVEFALFADTEGVFTALQTGEIDMHTRALQSGQIQLAQGEDHLSLVSVPGVGYNFVVWNVREAPFADFALRQAMAHAIDRTGLVETIVDGRGDAGTSVISPANITWHNPGVTTYDFSIDKAREILAAAGYSWDAEGRLLAPGG